MGKALHLGDAHCFPGQLPSCSSSCSLPAALALACAPAQCRCWDHPPAPSQCFVGAAQLENVLVLGVEYLFGQPGSAVPALLPQAVVPLLAGRARDTQSPWLRVSTAQQHQNIGVLSALFSSQIPSMALYWLLGRELALSQLKPGHLQGPEC